MEFLVSIDILRAAHLAAAKDDVRYYLNGIHFHNKRVEATNGHAAYVSSGEKYTPEWFDRRCEKKDLIIAISEKIPTTRNIRFAKIAHDFDDSYIIRYLDAFGQQVGIGSAKCIDGKYPNIPKLVAGIRRLDRSSDAVGFKTECLSLLDKMFNRKQRFPAVKIELFGSSSAAIFTNKTFCDHKSKETLVIMPVRMDRD